MTSHRVYPNDRIRSNNQFPSAEIHDEIVLMNMERGRYFSLNDTGSAIWKRLTEPVLVSALCSELAREYQADDAVIRREVIEVLQRMVENGLAIVVENED
jgi:hypothetical protein